MTPDPLGAIAAACRMYEGIPTYSLEEITDEERWKYAEQVQKTHLKAPLEFVKFHFFIEGVDRAFTHQMVRQRTAVFAQESLRFAVKHNMASEVVLPPAIVHGSQDIQDKFQEMLNAIEESYNWLVANGVPAEDARALLPHCVATRLNYCTDLRNLADHSGNRLCTQAQFIWREAFRGIAAAIRDHSPLGADLVSLNLFKPVCYQIGHCPFTATFDRGCTIRERVTAFASAGVSSEHWHQPQGNGLGEVIPPIRTEEWMEDERAAWIQ
jgi:flavin-dependent thymidylate synthase